MGDLKEGVGVAQEYIQTNYDVIISRGGAAEVIEKVTHIPAIEINLLVYDTLRAMELVGNYSDKYVVMGSPGITSSVYLLCNLLQYKLDIVAIHSGDRVKATLRGLRRNDCCTILCDMITNTITEKLGLNSILVTSGSEGIENALDQTYKLCISYTNIREGNSLSGKIIREGNSDTLIFDEKQNLYFIA